MYDATRHVATLRRHVKGAHVPLKTGTDHQSATGCTRIPQLLSLACISEGDGEDDKDSKTSSNALHTLCQNHPFKTKFQCDKRYSFESRGHSLVQVIRCSYNRSRNRLWGSRPKHTKKWSCHLSRSTLLMQATDFPGAVMQVQRCTLLEFRHRTTDLCAN